MDSEKQWDNYSKQCLEKCLQGIYSPTSVPCSICWGLVQCCCWSLRNHLTALSSMECSAQAPVLWEPSLFPSEQASLRWLQQKKGCSSTLQKVYSSFWENEHKIITESAYLGRDRLKDLLLTLRLVRDQTKIVLSLSHLMSPFLLLYCSW